MGRALTLTRTSIRPTTVVPDWWEPLYRRSVSASIFLSAEWLQSWLDVYAADFEGEWLRFTDGQECVGGCLILRRTVWWRCIPQPTIFLNVAAQTRSLSPWSEYNQAMAVAGYEEAVGAQLAGDLRRLKWALVDFSGYEDNEFSHSFLAGLPTRARQVREQRAPFVDLDAIRGKEYEATLSGKTRSQIRRTRRTYEEASGTVAIEFASTCEEALAYLDRLGALHNAIWRSRGKPGSFESPEFAAFHRLAVRRLWQAGVADLTRVRTGDKDIGYLLSFKRGRKLYVYQSGFVLEADKNLKPGLITHAMAIAAYARQDFAEYDLLAGDSRYKRSLTKNFHTLFWSKSFRDTLLGSALWGGRRLKARLTPNANSALSESGAGED